MKIMRAALTAAALELFMKTAKAAERNSRYRTLLSLLRSKRLTLPITPTWITEKAEDPMSDYAKKTEMEIIAQRAIAVALTMQTTGELTLLQLRAVFTMAADMCITMNNLSEMNEAMKRIKRGGQP